MRFAFWPNSSHPWSELLALAKHVEATGWDRLYFADHFMPNAPDTSAPWAEAWTTLAGLATAVTRIRIGPLVTGNTYRHPTVLAKMAATLDQLSGGRAVLGLGAGWQENEHQAYGIPFYTLRERLGRLDEACQVIRSLFENRETNFAGRYYRLERAPLEPKPVQQTLPILVGGGGEKVTLRIAARHADEWNVWGDVATLRRKMSILDGHCRDAGRPPTALQRSAVALLMLSDDGAAVERARTGGRGRPLIAGNVDEVRKIVAEYAAAGVDELVVPDFNLGPPERAIPVLDRFIREVAPAAR